MVSTTLRREPMTQTWTGFAGGSPRFKQVGLVWKKQYAGIVRGRRRRSKTFQRPDAEGHLEK